MMTPQDSPYWASTGTTEDPETQRLIEELLANGTIRKRPVQGYPYPRTAMPMQQTQGQQGGMGGGQGMGTAKNAMTILQAMSGKGGSSGGSSSSGLGSAMNTAGLVAAIIGLEHTLSKNTDRHYQGQQTKDMFGGSMATEPSQAWIYQKLGIKEPTEGEEFDAAWHNKDWTRATQKLPAALNHYGDPVGSSLHGIVKDKVGEDAANIIFPGNWISDRAGKLLSRLF